MQLSIYAIVLWPARTDRQPRAIRFVEDRVNIITGQSGTGKSSLIAIVDYALGSGKCAISVGRIRDTTAWFGVVLRHGNRYITVARRNPGDQAQTGDAMLVDATEPTIGAAAHNINSREVVDYLNQLVGLPSLGFQGGEGATAYDARPSFRDLAAFNYQPQHIVANPYTLFYKADSEDHRRKLANVLPFVLGSLTADQLSARRRLVDVERDIRVASDELAVRQSTVKRIVDDLRSDFVRAREYGIVQTSATNGWTIEDYAKALEGGLRVARESGLVVPDAGGTEAAVAEMVELAQQEDELARGLSLLRGKLERLERIGRAAADYGDALVSGGGRLEGLGWFKERVASAVTCALCGSSSDAAQRELAALSLVAEEVQSLSTKLRNAPAVLDREREETRARLRALEDELGDVRRRAKALSDASAREAARRQVLLEVYRFIGAAEQRVLTFRGSDKGSEAASRLAVAQQERTSLLQRLDKKGVSCCFRGLSPQRPGSSGHNPPRASMTMAIRGSAE